MKSKRGHQSPTEKEINVWLDSLFSPVPLVNETEGFTNAAIAFENLTGFYILRILGHAGNLLPRVLESVHFDDIGLISMLRRFQRDAYGLQNFSDFIANTFVEKHQLEASVQDEILERVTRLGVPIAAVNPKKTRIAAAFSHWMSVWRPVTINPNRLPEIQPDQLALFCAGLNFFLASTYLRKFGLVFFGESGDANADIFLVKIKYDLTYRTVNIASLATLYDAIFRFHPRAVQRIARRKSTKRHEQRRREDIRSEDIPGIPVSIETAANSAVMIAKAKDPFSNEF